MENQFQDLARNQMQTASSVAQIFISAATRIATENSEFAGMAFRNHSAWLAQLAAVKTVPELFQAQTDNARAHYLAMIGQTKKLGNIISEMMEDAVRTAPRRTAPAPAPSPEKRAA